MFSSVAGVDGMMVLSDVFMIQNKLKNLIKGVITELGIEAEDIHLEHPAELAHGDYSTNVAMAAAKMAKVNPKALAEKIAAKLNEKKDEDIAKIEVAGPGFINLHLSSSFFGKSMGEAVSEGDSWGRNKAYEGKKVMVEYTDPNPFKEFHIGHLMSNAIGESIAQLIEFGGAKVKRANWQGDVGPHVAKALWGKMQKPGLGWGEAYAYGAGEYDAHKEEIDTINQKVYAKSDSAINALYDEGRAESLKRFEELYKTLGTTFDHYFFEGKEGLLGKPIVEEFLKKGVFEESDGAVVFKGEKYNLHTRVFLTSRGLPTYEAKELGLNKTKFEVEPDLDASIIVTANEQTDYFRVVLKVMELIFPEIASKTTHIAHGVMKFASGKMSSRKGNVVTGESLLLGLEKLAEQKINEGGRTGDTAENLAEVVAVGAIKYSILKQNTGRDIVFDPEQSLSFEGDSGPYLQYTHARARSILRKAEERGIEPRAEERAVGDVERMLYRFPEVVARASKEYEPHYVTTYLTELAGAFNTFYAKERILDAGEDAPYRVLLTEAVAVTLKNGLHLLGIKAPEVM
ncbi:MAG: arginine--tRNA ligase [Parcubacteria group bacterium]|nr:arginine--tRNA ligase [Parcubacteria group bacterium]